MHYFFMRYGVYNTYEKYYLYVCVLVPWTLVLSMKNISVFLASIQHQDCHSSSSIFVFLSLGFGDRV